MMEYNEFKEYYEKYGKCPNDLNKRKNTLNEKQLESRYEKYVASEQKKIEAKERHLKTSQEKPQKIDEKYSEVRAEALKIHGEECVLLRMLSFTPDETTKNLLEELKRRGGHLVQQVDVAHVFGRGSHPELKYDVDNLIPLNRWSHSNLDQYRHPILGVQIDRKECEEWWKTLIGPKKYNLLKNKILKKNRKKIK